MLVQEGRGLIRKQARFSRFRPDSPASSLIRPAIPDSLDPFLHISARFGVILYSVPVVVPLLSAPLSSQFVMFLASSGLPISIVGPDSHESGLAGLFQDQIGPLLARIWPAFRRI